MMFGRNPGSEAVAERIPANSVGVEIGVWKGDSSEKFLRRTKHLHLVDPWAPTAYEDSTEFGDYPGYLMRYAKIVGSHNPDDFQKYYDKVYADVVSRFKGKPVTIWRATSKEFFKLFTGTVDWIYLDGSHEYAQVYQDIISAIKIADCVYGDDYGNKPGVTRAVDDISISLGLNFEVFAGNQYRIY